MQRLKVLQVMVGLRSFDSEPRNTVQGVTRRKAWIRVLSLSTH